MLIEPIEDFEFDTWAEFAQKYRKEYLEALKWYEGDIGEFNEEDMDERALLIETILEDLAGEWWYVLSAGIPAVKLVKFK